MSRRKSYSDNTAGEADRNIRAILGNDSEEYYVSRIRHLLMNVIDNELTEKQRNIVMLYYFKGMDTVRISRIYGVTPQAVSAVLSRARLKLQSFIKYIL